MPDICRFPNCRVRINRKDHAPPHFHVVMNDGRDALVRIDTLEILRGRIAPREIADVLRWAAQNREWLLRKFEELRQ